MHRRAAGAPAESERLSVLFQLQGGNSPRGHNGCQNGCEQCGFGNLFNHVYKLLSIKKPDDGLGFRPRDFAGDWSPVGCDEQNPVVDSRGKAQIQPVEQGCVLLQLPLQAAKPFASDRSWQAETVPRKAPALPIVQTKLLESVFTSDPLSYNFHDCRAVPREHSN